MLVLSRFEDEEIVIGDNAEIVLSVVRARDGKARIGITAAKSIPIHRREIYDQIKASGGQRKSEPEQEHQDE